MSYITWKDYAADLASLRATGDMMAYQSLVASIMAEPTTHNTPWAVWRGDAAGKPYAGMQQAALGKELIRGGQTWGIADYISIGQRMLEVCRLRERNGGLRANSGAWVFTRTGDNPDNSGNTLNQEVLLARDMIEAGRMIGRTNYIEIGTKAVDQLGDAGRFPSGWTFVLGGSAVPKKKSWLYYDAEDTGQGGFIGDKTGGYTVLALRTLRQIALLYAGIDFGPLKPWLRFCADAYRAKGDIHVDSTPAPGGNWKGCEDKIVPLTADELAWLENPA